VLETVKRDDALKQIPVIVLTTSSDERDVHACYVAGANSSSRSRSTWMAS